ncbi:MAG TPA: outer membrane lipoprotein-sorting protein [candidate division Zixibacteria bacterium]|nr:outer membrane lipoprotein-sorting protein [candidate division Zixibacteria bacterium]
MLTSWLIPVGVTTAATPEERGLQIAVEADRRDSGWGDQTADLVMILTNRHGESSRRELTLRSMEVQGDGDKSLTTFHTPRDVQGTTFLSYTHVGSADDQWLYLPALKRVKRISSGNKSGPFMGSEFAYEDLTSQEVEKYTYRYLRDESLDGQQCFVVERTPTYENSGYTRQIAWIDQVEYRPLKIEFYDRKEALLKTLTYQSYRQYLDRYWRAQQMHMVNHQTGKETILEWNDYTFGAGFTDRDFDQSSLKRVR